LADIIFDLDGTLTNCEHRIHYVRNKPKRNDLFHKELIKDTPIIPTTLVLKALLAIRHDDPADDHRILYATGRPESSRQDTLDWFWKYHEMTLTNLYMRADKDHRKDDVVKQEMLIQMRKDGFNPIAAFEDRKMVQDMWIRNGIFLFDIAQQRGDF